MVAGEQVIYETNVYLDSSKSVRGDGLNFEVDCSSLVNLNSFGNNASYFKLTLMELTANRAFYNINNLNNTVKVIVVANGTTYNNYISLSQGDYPNIYTIANEFCIQLNNMFATVSMGLTNTSPNFTTNTTTDLDQTTYNNLLLTANGTIDQLVTSITFDFSTNASGTWEAAYRILGGRQNINGSASPTQGLNVVIGSVSGSTRRCAITSFYPMQKATIDHVYLRTNLQNDTLTNVHGNDPTSNLRSLGTSDILAKIPAHDTYITWDDTGGNIFSMNVPYRQITAIKMYLTTRNGELLPVVDNLQAKLGSMNCTMCVRLQVIKNVIE